MYKQNLEYLAVCCLKWATQKTTVAEFAKKFGLTEEDLTTVPWTKRAHMEIPSIGSISDLNFEHVSNALENFLSNMKTEKEIVRSPLFIKLDHLMRPDALSLVQISQTEYFSILLSTKLYNPSVPSVKAKNDQSSTDLYRVYCQIDGNIHPKKKKDRDTWDSLLLKYSNFQHVGSLRVHVLLPRIQESKTSDKDPKLKSHVLGNDVVLYVELSNSSILFNEEARKLLALATDTSVNDWK